MWRKVIDDYRLLYLTDMFEIKLIKISKISSEQKRLFFAVCLHPLSFFANTPFKKLRLQSL